MNSQDFRNLQEAYLEVGMNEEKRKYPYSKVHNQNIRLQRNASSETDPEKQEAKYKQADRHHGIHTRVRNLPYHQLGNPENRLKPNGKTTSNSTSSQSQQSSSGETVAQRARRDPEFKKQMVKDRMKTLNNSYDLYDIILSHLIDEGYADTEDSALVIMANMSEEWRESIVEDYKPWDFGPKQKAKRKYDQLVKDKAAGNSPPGTATRANTIASVAKDMRTTLDKNSASTGTNPAKQGLQPATRRHTAAALRGAGGGMTASKTYDVKPLNRR